MTDLPTLLGAHLQRGHFTAGQVAARAGVPRRTVYNWLNGRVRKPRRWQELLRVAAALNLDTAAADALLDAAGHPPLAALRASAAAADADLLAPWPAADAPFQAIADLPYFTGRDDVLAELEARLLDGQAVALCSLQGMGGVGKSSLAAHLAYRLRRAFPDGVLWARLDAADTMSILGSLAAAYGEDVSAYRDEASRAAAVRGLLANKRALLVLDNAERSAQVRPLLPPAPGKTAVLVTTRHDLAVADDMTRVVLPPFDAQGAAALHVFTHFLGAAVVRRWRPQLRAIAGLLEQLPLAIAIAAGRLKAAGTAAVPAYLAALRAADQRLDALVREDRSVRLSFDLSYAALPAARQALFAELGAFDGADFDAAAAAAVTDMPPDAAAAELAALVGLSLLQPTRHGRFRLHALLRDYARAQQADDGATRRMVAYFVDFAAARKDDVAAMTTENGNLLAALRAADVVGLTDAYVHAARSGFRFWYTTGAMETAVAHLTRARALAAAAGDLPAEADVTTALGSCCWQLGQQTVAEAHFKAALRLAERLEDAALTCRTLINLSTLMVNNHGDYETAAAQLETALALAQRLENAHHLQVIHLNLGNISFEQGSWRQAAAHWQAALAYADALEGLQRAALVTLLLNLGVLETDLGQDAAALTHLTQALALAEELRMVEYVSLVSAQLAQVALWQDDLPAAARHLARAEQAARDLALPEPLLRALCGQAMLATQREAWDEANRCLDEADGLLQQAQIVWNEVDVLLLRGDLALARAQPAAAEVHFRAALARAEALNVALRPEAQRGVARALAAQGQPAAALPYAEAGVAWFAGVAHRLAPELQAWLIELRAAAAERV